MTFFTPPPFPPPSSSHTPLTSPPPALPVPMLLSRADCRRGRHPPLARGAPPSTPPVPARFRRRRRLSPRGFVVAALPRAEFAVLLSYAERRRRRRPSPRSPQPVPKVAAALPRARRPPPLRPTAPELAVILSERRRVHFSICCSHCTSLPLSPFNSYILL